MTRSGPATYVLIPGAGCTPWHWHPLDLADRLDAYRLAVRAEVW